MKTSQITKLDVIVLALVLICGLINLPYPFDGDQALFTVGASKISRGAILYREFWDLKQPGIFGFYLLAGKLFAFTEVGIHAFELIYMMAFAVVLQFTLKNYFENRAIASLVPLLTIGIYYGVARSWHLTQVEGLVGFPMYLCLWFASSAAKAETGRKWRLFLSGLMGGVVLLLKLFFLPILISFWLAAIAHQVLIKRERTPVTLFRMGVPVLCGLLLPVVIVLGYFARVEALGLLSYTYFEYPARAATELPGWRLGSLARGLLWFVSTFAPLTALALVWFYANWKKRRELLESNLLFLNLVLWLAVGFLVIVMQRLSWWDYHYLLLFVPIGILGTKGLDIAWTKIKEMTPAISSRTGILATILGLVLLFSSVIASLSHKAVYLVSFGMAHERERRLQYQSEISDAYRVALTETEFLSRPDSRPGGIFVAGNPIYYYLSGRDQAIASNGWMLELYLPEQWKELTEQLSSARPPYILIGSEYTKILPERGPETVRFITENYRVLRSNSAGTWYVLN